MRYIIAPLDLDIKEREIYWLLYRKVDFKTFEVKYTVPQLTQDSNSVLNLSEKQISRIIKNFLKLGYIEEVSKGCRGKPSIFRIITMRELIGNQLETNKELIGNQLETNRELMSIENTNVEGFEVTNKELISKQSATNRELISKQSVSPIKDKEKENNEKKENIYTTVYSYYLSKDLIKHKALTDGMKKAIDKVMKDDYKLDTEYILKIIDRHEEKVKETKNDKFPVKKRSLHELFGQKKFDGKGMIYEDYLDEVWEQRDISNNTVNKNNSKKVVDFTC